MALLSWIFVGVLVGIYAAHVRGFSIVGGAVGGAALGFLSPLLFLVGATIPSPERERRDEDRPIMFYGDGGYSDGGDASGSSDGGCGSSDGGGGDCGGGGGD